MNSIEFLDAVREKHGIQSDRKLAVFLKVDRTRIPAYRRGRRTLDPDACIAVAKALEVPPGYVMASVMAERAKSTEHRRIWEKAARFLLDRKALLLAAVLATQSIPTPPRATEPLAQQCILWKKGRGHDRRRRNDRRRSVRVA